MYNWVVANINNFFIMEGNDLKKMTDEQIKKLREARKDLLEKIDIFYSGLMFPETFAKNAECPRKQWIDVLRIRVKMLDVEKCELYNKSIPNHTEFELGRMTERYFSSIRELLLEEFGKVIFPFDTIIPEYERIVIEALES